VEGTCVYQCSWSERRKVVPLATHQVRASLFQLKVVQPSKVVIRTPNLHISSETPRLVALDDCRTLQVAKVGAAALAGSRRNETYSERLGPCSGDLEASPAKYGV
jgi:hypothetical protein